MPVLFVLKMSYVALVTLTEIGFVFAILPRELNIPFVSSTLATLKFLMSRIGNFEQLENILAISVVLLVSKLLTSRDWRL